GCRRGLAPLGVIREDLLLTASTLLAACLDPVDPPWYYNTTRHEGRSMPFDSIIWDLDDDPDGNVQHCAEHGVTKEEVEEVFQNATDADISRSSGRPVAFGATSPGRHRMAVYEAT